MSDHSNNDALKERIVPATGAPVASVAAAASGRTGHTALSQDAETLERTPCHLAAELVDRLTPGEAGPILSEMDARAAAAVVERMQPAAAAAALGRMRPDDRVDVLEHVSPPLHEQLVAGLDAGDADEVRRLERYAPDTAGGIMTTEVATLPEDLTVEQAVAELRRLNRELEQLFYVYVVDAGGRLSGVLSMRDLILAEPGTRLSGVARREVVSVLADDDQEQVARWMRRYDFIALPVVDADRRLLGVVTVDDVLDVLVEEATEDVQRMFGAGPEERLTSPWAYSFKRRIGWLGVNLVTAFAAASVVGLFEGTIAEAAVLAVYMPVVAGMGGNASAQAMAVAIRGMAVGEVGRGVMAHVFRRELVVGLLSGLCMGAAAAAIAAVFHHRHGPALGLVVGLALLVNHTLACVWGVAVPFTMRRLGFDPAQSATIFTTTLTDLVGFFTLLGLASAGMSWLR